MFGCSDVYHWMGRAAKAVRLSANWKLLLHIPQHAGGSWPEQARRSATYLSRAPYEPSAGVQLLAALRATFTKNRTEITSEQVVQDSANKRVREASADHCAHLCHLTRRTELVELRGQRLL